MSQSQTTCPPSAGFGRLTLWGLPGSSSTNRVRIALALKNIPYTFHMPQGNYDEVASDQYAKDINPMQQIPVLCVETGPPHPHQDQHQQEKFMVRQSVAILEYLEEQTAMAADTTTTAATTNVQPVRLLPADIRARAQVREVIEIVNSFIQPMQNKTTVEAVAEVDPVLQHFMQGFATSHVNNVKHHGHDIGIWPQKFIHKGFTALERILTTTTGIYCFGDTVTLADCVLVPQVIGAKKYHVDVANNYPIINKIYYNVIAIEAVKIALQDVSSSRRGVRGVMGAGA